MLLTDPFVEIVSTPLILEKYYKSCEDPSCGAIVTFTGVTRDSFQGKRTVKLEYEAYTPMAEKKLKVGVMLSAACNCTSVLGFHYLPGLAAWSTGSCSMKEVSNCVLTGDLS